jgi:MtrB/PioB family decaheme-associated outer membrane protein
MRRYTKSALAAAATAALASPAALAQVDTSNWNCEYCPFDEGYRAEFDAGASYVSDDALRFGNGTGYDEKGAYAEFDGEGRYVNDGTRIDWEAKDLGLDSRAFAIAIGRPGTYGIDIGYRAMPYRLFGSTSTVYSGSAGDLTLPSSWVPAATTSGFADLDASLRPINIEQDRDILEFGIDYQPTRDVEVYANYTRQQRDGVQIAAGPDYTQSGYIPRFIDDYTDQVDAGVEFALGGVDFNLAYYGSFYRNDIGAVTWDRLFLPTAGGNRGRAASEPDNDFQQFSLSGVYRADALNTTLAFSAAVGQGEQTAGLLPYTSNAALEFPDSFAPPPAALDGKVDTSNYALTLTSRPFNKARVKLSYRYDERDNQTPVSTWTRVIADAFVTEVGEQNVPYSFERGRLSVSASYRLFDTVTVSGGYDRTDLERDFQEVADQTEDSTWGKLRWRPTPYLEATFKGGDARREIDEYDLAVADSLGQNPLLRKYNLAYRYREFAEVSLSASLPEAPLSVGMTYLWADDSYTKSELGMTGSEENRFSFDVSWAASEKTSLYLAAGNESIDAEQVGSETFGSPAWQASHDDDFNHFGGGIRLASLGEKIDLVLDYTHSEGETEIMYSGMGVSAGALPELESELDSLHLKLSYDWSERLRTDFVLRWEASASTTRRRRARPPSINTRLKTARKRGLRSRPRRSAPRRSLRGKSCSCPACFSSWHRRRPGTCRCARRS